MEDKTQYEALMEEVRKIVENFKDGVIEIGERLSKLLPDIEISEEEEETWVYGHGFEDGQVCVKETAEQILNALERQQTIEQILKNVVR